MARTVLNIQTVTRAGLEVAYQNGDLANGHSLDNASQKVIIHVKNASVGSINVTIPTPGTVDGLAVADLIVAVPASEERFIGPFPRNVYGQAGSLVFVDLSDDTTVTLAALQVG
jgi:hypothetical protein